MRTAVYQPFMQAMLWTCKTCAFEYEGGQPKQNCPVCESYKTNFIPFPQNLEAEIRTAHPDVPFNNIACRTMRLELMKTHKVAELSKVAGRILPSVSGEYINPSEV